MLRSLESGPEVLLLRHSAGGAPPFVRTESFLSRILCQQLSSALAGLLLVPQLVELAAGLLELFEHLVLGVLGFLELSFEVFDLLVFGSQLRI